MTGQTGTIVKSLSGFYYIGGGNKQIRCRARGLFRKRGVSPLVGDRVDYLAGNGSDGTILSVHPRRNELDRPPIANIDQAVLTFSVADPPLDDVLLNRFLVHMESFSIRSVICLTKLDLLDEDGIRSIVRRVELYRKIGYPVFLTSGLKGMGIDRLQGILPGKITVVAGQSGVGKSSLINRLNPDAHIRTQAISRSLGRGKHTTRHVELLSAGGGMIADTPGFSSLEFRNIEAADLDRYFPEFASFRLSCRFRGCSHRTEPDCAVRAAVKTGEIDPDRYKRYRLFYQEIAARKKRY
ncbi:MAG: ribosome small subunit-dependent GTPase A [Sporolactobacillus sp.]|jgi:ribosome biogenesis GTPase|nr:ribosome small subunit-dependent GTPase A [Sporolactobacillus sp.]